MTQKPNNLAAYIWTLADLLRGEFKQSQYGRVIVPFTLLHRLEGDLEESKENVLSEFNKIKKMELTEEAQEKLLLRATNGLSFFNASKMDLSKLTIKKIHQGLLKKEFSALEIERSHTGIAAAAVSFWIWA